MNSRVQAAWMRGQPPLGQAQGRLSAVHRAEGPIPNHRLQRLHRRLSSFARPDSRGRLSPHKSEHKAL
jgi:hypothetical protein